MIFERRSGKGKNTENIEFELFWKREEAWTATTTTTRVEK
jgi:hypothetical protein